MAAPKRALRSLSFALVVPLALTLAVILLFGSGSRKQPPSAKSINWFPPLWFMHAASLGSSMLMGLSAWLVWAEGGFRSQPDCLPLYVAEVSLSLIWYPLVLKIEAAYLGLFFCLLHFGTLMACYQKFRLVNLVAGEFVKPCLAWLAFLTFVSFKLVLT